MNSTPERYKQIKEQIREAERRYGREPGSVQLLAVSKTKPLEAIKEFVELGQKAFGENYLQEAVEKIESLDDRSIEWHFIGPLQSNKTRQVATNFDWVHSVDRLKLAQRLSEQRDAQLPPLNICIQVNISGEVSKSGVALGELPALVSSIAGLPHLKLRGLMAIPAPEELFEKQREAFAKLSEAMKKLNDAGYGLDTLSMGMSGDLEAAIAEGSTMVRIGTALFGERDYKTTEAK